jgi:hypothetical protein
MPRSLPLLAALPLVAALTGCNDYEMFRLAGFAQEDFSNKADLLFVTDNSSSMIEESAALAVNFDRFIDRLVNPTGLDPARPPLTRAVADYVTSVSNRGAIIDFQIALTSTDVGADYGRLYAGSGQAILQRSLDDVPDAFRYHLLCEATCFVGSTGGLPSKSDPEVGLPGWQCGDPLQGDVLYYEYNDCLCGGRDVWRNNCGSGQEEHIEATLLAMCRALDPDDPSPNIQGLLETCGERTPFDKAVDGGSNLGLIRPDSTFIPVIITDEGDTSRRLPQAERDPKVYTDLFKRFPTRMAWAVIGPNLSKCNNGNAVGWGVERFERLVQQTNGMYVDIEADPTDGGDCPPADFDEALRALGDLLAGLLEAFPLQAVPDVDTIRVYVEGKRVDRAPEENDGAGIITYGDGWSYDATINAVRFHGDAVPDYRERVRIYYRPLEGMPRSLPF